MNLKFKFACEKLYTVVEMPPNLILAMKEVKQEKTTSILLYFILAILSLFLYFNAQAKFVSFFIGDEWAAIFIIMTITFGCLLCEWILDKKPKSIELYCCMMIKDFDQYIDSIIQPLETMLGHECILKRGISNNKIKEMEKTLITAQLLKELNQECLDSNFDLRDNIRFIEEHINDIKNFEIKKVTYGKKKKTKRRSRRTNVNVRGSRYGGR